MNNSKGSNPKYRNDLLDLFIKASKSRGTLLGFLEEILTPAELREVEIRLQILKQLMTGRGHREIISDLKVGVATITRGVRVLDSENCTMKQILSTRTAQYRQNRTAPVQRL